MRTLTRQAARAGTSALRGARLRIRDRRPTLRVGWVAADTLHGGTHRLSRLHAPVSMRITNTALWINGHSGHVRNEIYRPDRRYDVVVFFKAMDARCQEEAARIRERGGRVVFDANVNYYEVWGDYEIEGTRPTPEQQIDAAAMTRLADHVVADSSYLLDIVRRLNTSATWIPDNVDVRLYRGRRDHRARPRTRLVWSGTAPKAAHLLAAADALADLRDAELVVVSNAEPAALATLRDALTCTYVRFSDARYAATLRGCDVVISPKRLTNAYELAHTEYKITLGMAVGLPAVASPQQSYVEAIGARGGGVIAASADEWRDALAGLCEDPALRADLGARARATVRERYATAVVATRYLHLIETVAQ